MFFIERPGDEYGNVGYVVQGKYPIIEAIPLDEHLLRVLAPVEFRSRWPTVNARLFIEIEHNGRAQLIDYKTLQGCRHLNCIHITTTLREAYQHRSAAAMVWLLQMIARFLSGSSLAAVTEAQFLSGKAFPGDKAMQATIQRELDAIPQMQGIVLNYPLPGGSHLVLQIPERGDLSISLRSQSEEMQRRFAEFQARQGYFPSSADRVKAVIE